MVVTSKQKSDRSQAIAPQQNFRDTAMLTQQFKQFKDLTREEQLLEVRKLIKICKAHKEKTSLLLLTF